MALGTGYADPDTGVWLFGEDDGNGSLLSDTLNKLGTTTRDAILADRARLTTLEGRVSAWANYVPVLTNFSMGTGGSAALVASWRTEQDRVRVKFRGVFGNAGGYGVTGIPTFTLPTPAAALDHPYEPYPGSASAYDLSATTPYILAVVANNTDLDKARFVPMNSGAIASAIGTNAPFTWTSGDVIRAEFTYRKG